MNARLHFGDCLEMMKALPDGSVDAVITDPPYGIDFVYDSHDDDPNKYAALMVAIVREANRVVNGGPVFMWQAMKNCARWHEWFAPGYRIFAACRGFTQFFPTQIQYSFDPVVFWGTPKTEPSVYRRDYHIQSKAPFGIGREHIEHPCPRPLEQVQYIVELATLPGAVVLDPFMGSGTTGVACAKLGRDFIGMEIDAGYYAIAKRRIEAAQAQPALPMEL